MQAEQHVSDLLPAYSIGALDQEELRLVEEHLGGCSICQAELAAYQEVVDRIPLGVPMHAPPSRVRQAILHTINPPLPQRVAWTERLRNWLRTPFPAWGLVSMAILLIAALLVGAGLWVQNQQLARGQPGDFRVVALAGSPSTQPGNGWIVISRDGQSGTLIVQGLPALKYNHKYQLWLYQGEQPTSGGTFWVDARGYASLWVSSPKPLSEYQRFSITVEPEAGSSTPTGATILSGKL